MVLRAEHPQTKNGTQTWLVIGAMTAMKKGMNVNNNQKASLENMGTPRTILKKSYANIGKQFFDLTDMFPLLHYRCGSVTTAFGCSGAS